jgi:hypothetical protein
MTTEEIRQGVLDTFLRIADRFGVPCVVLAVVLYFGREACQVLYSGAVEPVVKSHIEFLEATSETLHEISSVQTQQANTLQELAEGQHEIKSAISQRN